MQKAENFYLRGFGSSSSHTIGPMRATKKFLEVLEKTLELEDFAEKSDPCKIEVTFSGESFFQTGVGHKSHEGVKTILNDVYEKFEWYMTKAEGKPGTFNILRRLKTEEGAGDIMKLYRFNKVPVIVRFKEIDDDFQNVINGAKKLEILPSVLEKKELQMLFKATIGDQCILTMTVYSVGGGNLGWVSKFYGAVPKDTPSSDNYLFQDEEYYPEVYEVEGLKALISSCTENCMDLHEFVNDERFIKDFGSAWLVDETNKDSPFYVMTEAVNEGMNAVDIENAYFDVEQKVRRQAYSIRVEVDERYFHQRTEENERFTMWKNCVVFPPALAVMETNIRGADGRVKVCTAPTCGSCGVLPGVLQACGVLGICNDKEGTRKALEAAYVIGSIVKKNATVSGNDAGCGAEIGVAAAMAAAAMAYVTHIKDTRTEKEEEENEGEEEEDQHQRLTNVKKSWALVSSASALALRFSTGLTCDITIFGEVTIPCLDRNAIFASQAMFSSELMHILFSLDQSKMEMILGSNYLHELMNGKAFDDAVRKMHMVGSSLPEPYRETSRGPTGKVLNQNYGPMRLIAMKEMKSILHNYVVGPGSSSVMCTALYQGILEFSRNLEKWVKTSGGIDQMMSPLYFKNRKKIEKKMEEEEGGEERKSPIVLKFYVSLPPGLDKFGYHILLARNAALRDFKPEDENTFCYSQNMAVYRIDTANISKQGYFYCLIQVKDRRWGVQNYYSLFRCFTGGHYQFVPVEEFNQRQNGAGGDDVASSMRHGVPIPNADEEITFWKKDMEDRDILNEVKIGGVQEEVKEDEMVYLRKSTLEGPDIYTQHWTLEGVKHWCKMESSKDLASYVFDREAEVLAKERRIGMREARRHFIVHLYEKVWGTMIRSMATGLARLFDLEKKEGMDDIYRELILKLEDYDLNERLTLYSIAVVLQCADGLVDRSNNKKESKVEEVKSFADGGREDNLIVSTPFGNLGVGIIPAVIAVSVESRTRKNIFQIALGEEDKKKKEKKKKKKKFYVGKKRSDSTFEAKNLIVRGLSVAGLVANIVKTLDIPSMGLSDLILVGACASVAAIHIRDTNAINECTKVAEMVIEHSLGLVHSHHLKEPYEGNVEAQYFRSFALDNASMARKALDAARFVEVTNPYYEISFESILWVLKTTNEDLKASFEKVRKFKKEEYQLGGKKVEKVSMMSAAEFFRKEYGSKCDILVNKWWK